MIEIEKEFQAEFDQIIENNYFWYESKSIDEDLQRKILLYLKQKKEIEQEKSKISLQYTNALRTKDIKLIQSLWRKYNNLMEATILLQHLIFGKPFEFEERYR